MKILARVSSTILFPPVKGQLADAGRKSRRRFNAVIAVTLAVLLSTTAGWYHQSRRVKKLQDVHLLAENIFFKMKELELRIAGLQNLVSQYPDAELRRQVIDEVQRHRMLQQDYSEFADELGFSPDKLSEPDWLIYKMARIFGECDVNISAGFLKTVQAYIKKWQSTPRLRTAIERAQKYGYAPQIVQELLAQNLPPQFFYLALQESDFDTARCGPQTRYGLAKGAWQFIPTTAKRYGLRVGQRRQQPRSDTRDERHNFAKSTRAAAQYLRDLYETEAQASGLLVMACYNWGETNIRRLINRMPPNPRERNFWCLFTQEKIPQQTTDYVFYIFSAAVIGENPRLFGFDFENPLANSAYRSRHHHQRL